MTPEQLRMSILHAAFQGKLVEQRAEEGNAELLYKQCQSDISTAIKLGEIKKQKTLSEITDDDIVFDIPSSWRNIKLGEVSQLIDGEKVKGKEYKYLEVKYLRGSIEAKTVTEGKFAKEGQLVILVDGENSGEVFTLPEDGYLGSTFKVLYIINTINVEYVLKFFELKRSELRANKKGAAIPHLNKDLLFNYVLPLPPLEEQHRIVAKIEELLPYVDRYAEVYEKLEQFDAKFPEDMKKSILQYAIQGKLVEQRPEEGTAEELYCQIQEERQKKEIKKNKKLLAISEEDYLFDIPETWKWVRVGDIFQTSSGTTPSKSNREYYDSPDYSWVRTTDLNNGILTHGEIKISQKAKDDCNLDVLPYNSVCLAMYGGGGTIGKNALIQFETTINQSVCAIHPNGFCNMKYLLYYMQFFRPLWMLYAAGSRKDPNINQIVINNAIFPLPPLQEQKRIVAKIEELLPYCDKLLNK